MPLSKEDVKPKKADPVEEAPAEEAAPSGPHPGDLTPGMYAEQEVGYSDAEPGSAELAEHGEKFAAAKKKQRFG